MPPVCHRGAIAAPQEVVAEGQALPRALELAARIAEYPQASLRSDRQAARASFGLALDEGLLLERRLAAATLQEPEMAEALQRFAKGDRPEPPHPP